MQLFIKKKSKIGKMKKKELVYREMLYQAIEKNKRVLTQAELARTLAISLSTVNNALKPLVKMWAVDVKKRNFSVIDIRKVLYYWASVRNLEKDIVYAAKVEKPARTIESEMPKDVVFTAYSGYKFKFKDVPSDYSDIYIYSENIEEIKRRFGDNKGKKNFQNLFVLKTHDMIKEITIAQLFVDLWNIKTWYAHEFLKALEKRINEMLEI